MDIAGRPGAGPVCAAFVGPGHGHGEGCLQGCRGKSRNKRHRGMAKYGYGPQIHSQAQQEAQAKAQKENMTVKTLNEKLLAAKTATDAGDFESAITTLKDATDVDASRDLLWFKLGDAYRMSANKQTDPAEKKNRYEQA